ncbi:MAG: hypothetical protein Q8Q32_00220 [bacterium]|nr:hypothetical protein [bacterium]
MPKRNQSEITYRALHPNGDPFSYKPEKDRKLETIGLVLWVTEGDKTQLSLANGNPFLLQKYLEFLRTICNFEENRIRAVIHCHDTLPYEKCLQYWSKMTKIPIGRFRKPHIKKDKGGRRKFPYGICRVVAINIKLTQIFKERLKELGLPRD